MNSVAHTRTQSMGTDRPRCRVAPSALALLASARQGLAAAEDEVTAGGPGLAGLLALPRAQLLLRPGMSGSRVLSDLVGNFERRLGSGRQTESMFE